MIQLLANLTSHYHIHMYDCIHVFIVSSANSTITVANIIEHHSIKNREKNYVNPIFSSL